MKAKWIVTLAFLLIFVVGCSAALSTGAIPAYLLAATRTPVVDEVQPVQYDTAAVLDQDMLAAVQTTFRQIYLDVNPSVVNIEVTGGQGPMQASGEGSGFVWDTKGHIVTNNHVVEDASQINVTFADGTSVEAKLVGTDPESDLAVIQVDAGAVDLHPVALADSQAVQVGDLAIAIGNPYGLAGTMTQGIISALSRSLAVAEANGFSIGSYTIPDIIQTDAAINPGNSGGVLVDVQGQVIGVTSAIRSASSSNSGIGFVIPSHIVARVVPVLIEKGAYQHPRMGISGATLTPSLAKQAGVEAGRQGVLVVSVTENSPADRAGLIGASQQRDRSGQITLSGGDVILAIDGQAVHTFEDLISYVFNETQVGQQVTLTILRAGAEQTIELTLGLLD